MGQRWNKLLDALRASEDDDTDLDKNIGKEVRNLFKDKKLDDLQDHLNQINIQLEYKDILIQLLQEEIEQLKKDLPEIPKDSEISEARNATSKDESQSTT